MKGSFRQSLTWLHTWVGLVLGWVCFLIFLTGSLSYYRPEITRWMRPELAASSDPRLAAERAFEYLESKASDAKRWLVQMPDERSHELKVYWQPAGGRFQSAELDPRIGEVSTARSSYGGEFFYRFHFQLLLPHPWGRYFAGVAALVMFVAVVTGIVAHRHLLADLFKFRLGKASWRSWLDFHNSAGLLTLPFFLLITFSALVIFQALYLPWPAQLLGLGRGARSAPAAETATVSTPEAKWPSILADAQRRWPAGAFAERIDVEGRGTAEHRVTLVRGDHERVSLRAREELVYDGNTGGLLRAGRVGEKDGAGQTLQGVFYGLHLARFANPVVRGLLFSLGLLGSGLIASGLILWVVKRRGRPGLTRGERVGLSLVEHLNVAALAGFPFAIAVYLWANRLLPLELEARQDREVLCFLIAWGVSVLHAVVSPLQRAWFQQLVAAAVLFLLVPLLDLFVGGEYFWRAARSLDFVYLGVPASAWLAGLGLTVAAGRVRRSSRGSDTGALCPPPRKVVVKEKEVLS